MMSPEAVPELLPVDAFWLLVGFDISIPPICSGTIQLVRSEQNLLTVVALDQLQLLFNGLQPIVSIHWLNGVRECRRFGPLKHSKIVTGLGLWHWLMPLSLHYQNLLNVGGGGGLALLLLFSLAPQLRVLAI
jgi:hypothetical protein